MYQALYRKWRPRFFDDVVGQSHITQTLKKQVSTERLSHAYLFTGTRGTGKTTCAKIMAKAVNCQNNVEGNPCGRCPACLGIDSGSVLDVVELDAASNNGVDQVRALRDEAVYAPAAVKKRVYIVDEVHMLSVAAFNALLKILEEPPEHLMFILATTELHKVPATILSRCQRFSFKRIQLADIQNRMLYIAENEGIDLTEDGAALLARLADGALRDALSLLDQCAISGRRVDKEAVLDTLGLAGNLRTAHLMDHIRRSRTAQALTELNDLYASGKDVSAVLDELAGLCRDLLLMQTTGGAGSGLMAGGYDEATLAALSKGLSPQRLLHMLTLLQNTLSDLKTSVNRKTDAELCLIRLCDQRLDGSVLALSERLSRIEAAMAGGAAIPVQMMSPAQEAAQPPFVQTADLPAEESEAVLPEEAFPAEVAEDMQAVELAPWDEPTVPMDTVLPEVESLPQTQQPWTPPIQVDAPPQQEQPTQTVRTVAPRATAVVSGGDANFWKAMVPELRPVVGRGLYSYIADGRVTGLYESGVLTLYTNFTFASTRLNRDEVRRRLEDAAAARAGRNVRIMVQLGAPPAVRASAVTVAQGQVQTTVRQELPPQNEAAPVEELPFTPTQPEEKVALSGGDPLQDLLAFAAAEGSGIIEIVGEG